MMFIHSNLAALAFFQGTQLNLFERFVTQAVAGINSTSTTAGMQNAAYVVLLIGFLWQVYHSALHGGDVRSLGTSLIKYIVTAIVVMNYGTIFTTVNQGFVNAGNWISNASGGNVFENWMTDLKNQFAQDGTTQLWGLVTGSIAGLIDGLLIVVAYLLYPFVVAVFGFFYIFYGSVLYIFGPIIIGLMPLGATNRIARAYIENVFIWNSWPILYGGFGALLTAVQMGQVGQMLNQNDFLGGLGNLEGSFLIGIASIIFSLAIAVIPFIAKRIVSGDVGSTASALIGAAATALTVGAAAVEGAAVGAASAGVGGPSASSAGGSATASATAGSAQNGTGSATANLPTPPQASPRALSAPSQSSVESTAENAPAGMGGFGSETGPTLQGHADQMRGLIGEAVGADGNEEATVGEAGSAVASIGTATSGSRPTRSSGSSRPIATARRGPTVHRYNLGTWGAFHAARIAAGGVVNAARRTTGQNDSKSNS